VLNKLKHLRFGYCTGPYCDFDNIFDELFSSDALVPVSGLALESAVYNETMDALARGALTWWLVWTVPFLEGLLAFLFSLQSRNFSLNRVVSLCCVSRPKTAQSGRPWPFLHMTRPRSSIPNQTALSICILYLVSVCNTVTLIQPGHNYTARRYKQEY